MWEGVQNLKSKQQKKKKKPARWKRRGWEPCLMSVSLVSLPVFSLPPSHCHYFCLKRQKEKKIVMIWFSRHLWQCKITSSQWVWRVKPGSCKDDMINDRWDGGRRRAPNCNEAHRKPAVLCSLCHLEASPATWEQRAKSDISRKTSTKFFLPKYLLSLSQQSPLLPFPP